MPEHTLEQAPNRRILAIAAVSLLLIGAVGSASLMRGTAAAVTPEDAPKNTITVRGIGRVTMKPDTAVFSVGIEATAPKAGAAMDDASTQMAAIIAALKKLGIADADLTTTQISLNPTYDYKEGDSKPIPAGYSATQTLSVKARALDKAGSLIDASVDASANQVGGISFTVDDPTQATGQARTAAVEDARKRAEALAKATGVTLGAVTSITETGGNVPPPIPYARDSYAAAAPEQTPVQAGTTELTVEVDVVFAIG